MTDGTERTYRWNVAHGSRQMLVAALDQILAAVATAKENLAGLLLLEVHPVAV